MNIREFRNITIDIGDDILANNSVRGALDECVPAGERVTIFDVAHGANPQHFERITYPIYDRTGRLVMWAYARVSELYLEFTSNGIEGKARDWLAQRVRLDGDTRNWICAAGPLGLVDDTEVWRGALSAYVRSCKDAGGTFAGWFVNHRGSTCGSWPETTGTPKGLWYQITLLAAVSHRIATWPVRGSTLDTIVESIAVQRDMANVA